MKVVIMAGGYGTRISELFSDIPKPLIPICGKPVLERAIESLRNQGFKEIILTVAYMHEKIEEYFGDGCRFGVDIRYFVENQPLGNAGALFKLGLNEDFLLLNADSVFDIDFNRMLKFHHEKDSLATLFTHPNSHPYDSGVVIAGVGSSVSAWLAEEDKKPKYYKNRVNAGLHVLSPAVLAMSGINAEKIGPEHRVDLDRMLLRPLCGTGKMFAYDSSEYVKDMGTPNRYRQVNRDFQNGVVRARNLKNKQKVIFLDRDGTINRYVGFLRNIDEFELLPGVAEAIRKINLSGYLAIVVTNQPVVARGEVSCEELDEIHNKMETLLGAKGAYIDGLYYCPHHPHKGYRGEVARLKINCGCRKPKPGMLLLAASDFNIDLASSWIIGDGENDILTGKAAGCKTALIGTDDFNQDIIASNLLEAVGKIISL